MRSVLLLLVPLAPYLAACGPQEAFISGQDTELPALRESTTRPVLPVMPVARLQTGSLQVVATQLPVAVLGSVSPTAEVEVVARVDAGVPEEVGVSSDAGVFTDAGASPDTDLPGDAGIDAGTPAPGGRDGGLKGLAVSAHLALGVPDDSSLGLADRWLLVRPQLVSSYDTTRKVPRWSSWKLEASDFGPATRATTFRVDPLLPTGTPQARDSDYVGSGFDRGHLCPSADRTATDADNDATFFLTNVVPQTHASNAGPWLDLEDEARTLAGQGKRLVIIAGPIFGVTSQAIGTGVQVPLSMFKVAVVLDGAANPGTVTASTKVYAAIVPNATVLSGGWRTFQVTVDEVEKQTGLDFLSDVDPGLQVVLEARRDP